MKQSLELAFAPDNARNESQRHIIENFIPTDVFWKLFSPRHQVVFGSRGSGKTALSKMASFPFLSKFEHKSAQKIIADQNFIGVFVNTDIRFVGALRNGVWTGDHISDVYFVWKFNINCIKAFLVSADAILSYMHGNTADRYVIESTFSDTLSERFFKTKTNMRLTELSDHISNYEYRIRQEITASHIAGDKTTHPFTDAFSTDLFEPVQYVIRAFEKIAKINDTANWLFFIDEAEFLTKEHHKILNSFMRANTGRIFIKLATLTYFHHTLETNLNVHLQPDHDFEYVYIDANPIYSLNLRETRIYEFARELYKNRIENFIRDSGNATQDYDAPNISSLDNVLGKSPLEKAKPLPPNMDDAISTISEFVDERTLARAKALANSREKFGNEVWRKLTGIIYLIEDKRKTTGNKQTSCYSGVETTIRCTDGVPRKMINLFKSISREAFNVSNSRGNHRSPYTNPNRPVLSPKVQSRILMNYSRKKFIESIAVPSAGPQLKELLSIIGASISNSIHTHPISTDVIGSFKLDKSTREIYEKLVHTGVAFGYMYPNISSEDSELIADHKSSYRLSFSLCPYFYTYPRRGEAVSLKTLIGKTHIDRGRGIRIDKNMNRFFQRDLFDNAD